MTGSDRSRRLLEAPAKVWADGSRVTMRFFLTSDGAGAAALVVVFLVVVVAAVAGTFGRGSSGRVAKIQTEKETVLRDSSGQRYEARAEGVRQEDLIRPRRRSEFRLTSDSFSNHSLTSRLFRITPFLSSRTGHFVSHCLFGRMVKLSFAMLGLGFMRTKEDGEEEENKTHETRTKNNANSTCGLPARNRDIPQTQEMLGAPRPRRKKMESPLNL